MGLFGRRRDQRALEEIGAAALHEELDRMIDQGNATTARWKTELAEVEANLAAVQQELDGFPGNGLVSTELEHLTSLREELQHQRWSLRGRIWLMVKPDSAPNEPPDDWQP